MNKRPPVESLQAALPDIEIGVELGSGGYKVVYEANIDGNHEALKVAHIFNDENDESVKDENVSRLVREIEILGSCETPNLVKLGTLQPETYEIGDETYVIYSEELIIGDTLRTNVQNGDIPSAQTIALIAMCCLGAIDELWTKGVVHRDIKPDNIMSTQHPDRPYILLDLGVAFVAGGTPLTRDTGRILGTRCYLPPETLQRGYRATLDFRADLYSLGLTLYEIGTCVNPFLRRDDDMLSTIQRIAEHTPEPMHSLRNDLPVEMCRIIDQLIKKRPAFRPNIESVVAIMEVNR